MYKKLFKEIEKLREKTKEICKDCLEFHESCCGCDFINVYNITENIHNEVKNLEIKQRIIKERIKNE